MAIKHWMRETMEKTGRNMAILMPFCGLTILLWAFLASIFARDFSNAFTRKHSQDDFFSPYYMRSDFTPLETVKRLKTLSKGAPKRVYLSQNCDFPSIIFYGKLKELPTSFWVCDFPGKTAPGFARDAIASTSWSEMKTISRSCLSASRLRMSFPNTWTRSRKYTPPEGFLRNENTNRENCKQKGIPIISSIYRIPVVEVALVDEYSGRISCTVDELLKDWNSLIDISMNRL
jgi:hypothetical protein